MIRLLFITDFTEQFAYRLLEGIINYSKESGQQWVICKMPPAYKRKLGMEQVVTWAKKWKADVVIGQFDDDDDVTLFRKNNIVALAQDYRHRFKEIPNITANYIKTGEIAADLFLSKVFKNYGFFGYNKVCWSDERCEGFKRKVKASGMCEFFSIYDGQNIDNLWFYETAGLREWLLSLPKPIAIMACDDNQANILLEACHSCGLKIPMEVSVIGVDNDEVLCNMSNPTISSINIDIARGGYEAARMAVEMMNDPSMKGEDVVLQPLYVVNRSSTSVFATKDPYVLKALLYIHENVDRKINVYDVLKNVPLSRRLLELKFKKEVGETIYSYLSEARIERFAELLRTTNDLVSNIALKMDEEDSKSISRRFKELKHCTPLEYRRRALNEF